MNAPARRAPPDIAKLEAGLARMVDSTLELRARRERRTISRSCGDYEETVRDCERCIHKIGQAIFDVGGLSLMREVFDRVASDGRRAAFLDARWNGVGSGDARWWS